MWRRNSASPPLTPLYSYFGLLILVQYSRNRMSPILEHMLPLSVPHQMPTYTTFVPVSFTLAWSLSPAVLRPAASSSLLRQPHARLLHRMPVASRSGPFSSPGLHRSVVGRVGAACDRCYFFSRWGAGCHDARVRVCQDGSSRRSEDQLLRHRCIYMEQHVRERVQPGGSGH